MRLEITKRADLAVRAMAALGGGAASDAAHPANVKAGDLAAELGTTPAFCTQVVAPLVRAGWVRSDPGPTGGYRLVAALDSVTVLQVIEHVDGPTDDGRCVVEGGPCHAAAPCLLHEAWSAARTELLRVLAAVSVSDVVGGGIRAATDLAT